MKSLYAIMPDRLEFLHTVEWKKFSSYKKIDVEIFRFLAEFFYYSAFKDYSFLKKKEIRPRRTPNSTKEFSDKFFFQ